MSFETRQILNYRKYSLKREMLLKTLAFQAGISLEWIQSYKRLTLKDHDYLQLLFTITITCHIRNEPLKFRHCPSKS